MTDNELYHHGILGQRWGVRRFQNEDGSYKKGAEGRYYDEKGSSQSTKGSSQSTKGSSQSTKGSSQSTKGSSQSTKKKNKYYNNGQLTEEGLKKYNENDSKGKYEKYKQMGLSKEDQFKANYDKEKIKKAAIVAGSAMLTAAAVYAGYKYVQNNVDTLVKSGTTLQNIANTTKLDSGRRFYASFHKLDNIRYGAIGAQLGFGTNDVYKHEIDVKNSFKIASNKSAKEAFVDLYNKDKDFKNAVIDKIWSFKSVQGANPKYDKMIKKSVDELINGKIGNYSYDLFNNQLAGGGWEDEVSNKFYNALKEKGYAGVKDVNDMKYTNYHSINPAIIFDHSVLGSAKVSELSGKDFATGLSFVTGQYLAGTYAPIAASAAVAAGSAYVAKKNSNRPQKSFKL